MDDYDRVSLRMQVLELAVRVAEVNSKSGFGSTSTVELAQNYWQWLNETNQTETPSTAQVEGNIPF